VARTSPPSRTRLVSGDAIKAFPNLANLPPYASRNAVFNNRSYAVPSVRSSTSNAIMFGKGKLLASIGGTQWGLGATSGAPTNGIPGIATFFLESFSAPNVWRESGGKLTKDWETDEFKSAADRRYRVESRKCARPGIFDAFRI
jgi:putative aldouronate transport system substrate-binding protein